MPFQFSGFLGAKKKKKKSSNTRQQCVKLHEATSAIVGCVNLDTLDFSSFLFRNGFSLCLEANSKNNNLAMGEF